MQPTGGGLKTKLTDLRDKLIMLRDKLDGGGKSSVPTSPTNNDIMTSLVVAVRLEKQNPKQSSDKAGPDVTGNLDKLAQIRDKIKTNFSDSANLDGHGLTLYTHDKLHITLVTLDQIPFKKINDAQKAVKYAVRKYKKEQQSGTRKITLEANQKPELYGSFVAYPVTVSNDLENLVEYIEAECKNKDVPVKFQGNFKPHISLGKITIEDCSKSAFIVFNNFYDNVKDILLNEPTLRTPQKMQFGVPQVGLYTRLNIKPVSFSLT
jgi:2'-5' RNA ligase